MLTLLLLAVPSLLAQEPVQAPEPEPAALAASVEQSAAFVSEPSAEREETVLYDQRTGLRWYTPLEGIHEWSEAKRLCADLGQELPTVEDYERAVGDGLGAIDAEHMTGAWYWTSSKSTTFTLGVLARAYQGQPYGYVVHLSVHDRISVRCVARGT